jgi:hypothetical protein
MKQLLQSCSRNLVSLCLFNSEDVPKWKAKFETGMKGVATGALFGFFGTYPRTNLR